MSLPAQSFVLGLTALAYCSCHNLNIDYDDSNPFIFYNGEVGCELHLVPQLFLLTGKDDPGTTSACYTGSENHCRYGANIRACILLPDGCTKCGEAVIQYGTLGSEDRIDYAKAGSCGPVETQRTFGSQTSHRCAIVAFRFSHNNVCRSITNGYVNMTFTGFATKSDSTSLVATGITPLTQLNSIELSIEQRHGIYNAEFLKLHGLGVQAHWVARASCVQKTCGTMRAEFAAYVTLRHDVGEMKAKVVQSQPVPNI